VFPLKSNIPPAKVQTSAASKRRKRLETFKFMDFNAMMNINEKRAPHSREALLNSLI
jgi:hypothetical protein